MNVDTSSYATIDLLLDVVLMLQRFFSPLEHTECKECTGAPIKDCTNISKYRKEVMPSGQKSEADKNGLI